MRMLRKPYPMVIAILAAAAVSAALWLYLPPPEEAYSVDSGLLSYSNRPLLEYGQEPWEGANGSRIYRVWIESHDNWYDPGDSSTVYGLLSIPEGPGPHPAFFILPGATVTKEGEHGSLGRALNDLGYATLALDQRGHGETGELIPPFENDYRAWLRGEESVQHLFVYDALRAFDLLQQHPEIDRARTYAAGESMGGNYAMIASGIEPRIAGLLLVSSSGFKFQPQPDPKAAEWMSSIMGDSYLHLLPPRPLLMLHSEADEVVPISHARETFDGAGEHKALLTINSTLHSYGTGMRGILEQGLEGW